MIPLNVFWESGLVINSLCRVWKLIFPQKFAIEHPYEGMNLALLLSKAYYSSERTISYKSKNNIVGVNITL